MSSLWQDIRYGLRQLRKSPGFAATAVTVLALGLGANIAVFTLIEGVLLRPLPYAKPDRLVSITGGMVDGFSSTAFSYANLRQLSDAAGSSIQTVFVMDQSSASVVGPGGRMQVHRVDVTSNMNKLVGVEPMLGRTFRPEENDPGKSHVVMLSEEVWRDLYHADPQIVGKTPTIKSEIYTIIGVMPKGFAFPFDEDKQVWAAAAIDPASKTDMGGK